eukprot:m.71152 g.71152  ORF g.71152 m.71152 type:complete len:692 (-) comp14142_c0_seq2:42-2117(-)
MCNPVLGRRRSRMKRAADNFVLGWLMVLVSPVLALFAVLHDMVMGRFIGQTYIYNMSWEDPDIDNREFNLDEDDHVLTIASAGDNALDYVIEGATVTAVDFNTCQIALAELKALCIQKLSYEEFFSIFAQNDLALLRGRYSKLRRHLTRDSASYWDRVLPSMTSFMYSGTSGFLGKVLSQWLLPLLGLNWMTECVRHHVSREEFVRACKVHERQLRTLAWIGDTILYRFSCLFAGVPQRQVQLGAHRPDNLYQVLQHIIYDTDLCNTNHYYGGYLIGEYTETMCPRYLMKQHFLKLRESLNAGKLRLFHGSLVDACRAVPEGERPFTVASLLDHMDWMPTPMVAEELAILVSKMDHQKGRLFWRSYADTVHSLPLLWLNPKQVDDTGDRIGCYFSTWIANLSDTGIEPLPRNAKLAGPSAGLLRQLKTGIKVVTFPILEAFLKVGKSASTKHGQSMEAFYAHQKDDYDSFREKFLHARPWLMHALPINRAGGMVWVDVGGGTARNLEYLPPNIVRDYFSKIVILDVSPSLLDMARRRVEAMGVADIVEIVEDDFTSPAVFDRLPPKGSVDVVTMSYSLSMIPDKRTAVRHAASLLKPDGKGHLGIADFFALPTVVVRKQNPSSGIMLLLRKLESFFHCQWFARDHVHLIKEDILTEVDKHCETIWDERERAGVPFLPFLKPFHGLVFARSR